MRLLCGLLFLTGAYPLGCAWRANRRTSLTHALAWASVAWLCWGLAHLLEETGFAAIVPVVRYLALCLTGCAEVAVLGARRPGVAAWNFVIAGLLIVVLMPLAQGTVLGGSVQLGGDRGVLLVGAVLIGCVNYLPTRFGPAVVLLTGACGLEMVGLLTGEERTRLSVDALLAAVPWAAWLVRGKMKANTLDRHWLDFRDRFGLVWGQRLREQFNHAAHHAGWPVELSWSGLRTPADAATQAACLTTLVALMKRFGLPNEA